jgi:hypothetical protein
MPAPLDYRNPPLGVIVYKRGAPSVLGLTIAAKSALAPGWPAEVQVRWMASGRTTWLPASALQSIEAKLLEDEAALRRYDAAYQEAKRYFQR